jgi:hypothetical protein
MTPDIMAVKQDLYIEGIGAHGDYLTWKAITGEDDAIKEGREILRMVPFFNEYPIFSSRVIEYGKVIKRDD